MCTDPDSTNEGDDFREESGGWEGGDTQADEEEETIDAVLGASGADPKPINEIRDWKDLREQLKGDIVSAHKKRARLTTTHKLLLLRNASGKTTIVNCAI